MEWASQAYTTKVDGSGQSSKFGEFSSFLATRNGIAPGNEATNTLKQNAADQKIQVEILLCDEDFLGADYAGYRQFPWTQVTDTSSTQLHIRLYGGGNLDTSAATLAVAVDESIYDSAASYRCDFA